MLATVSLFLLGTALALAQVPSDCKTGNKYRKELLSNVKLANPSMTWNCTLEEKAFNGELPADDAFQLTVKSTLPRGISPRVYIEVYPWTMYSMETWNCTLEEKAFNGELPADDAFQLTVKRYIYLKMKGNQKLVAQLFTALSHEEFLLEVYIEVYPWTMYSIEVNSYKKFGCYVKEKSKDVAIICQFSE
ncbi:hypothetical protein OESDEN_08316 [Oesophagostomum dentatum]|uniref:Uncharacterized protein n=1 Tax=Oesophagostomum dentatum TaxID=61180 RepID=A0A0B1T2M7_OESDE|nr:hypothetical protein OESDEN_08316 [Oesophagostomum dentatum]